MVEASLRCIECFVSFEAGPSYRTPKQPPAKTFAVILYRKSLESRFEFRGQTEAVEGSDTATFCKSVLISYDPHATHSASLCVELYQSDEVVPGKLQSEAIVGRAVSQMYPLLSASDMHFSANVRHPIRDAELVGSMRIIFEHVAERQEDELVQIELEASALKRREWPKLSLGQSFEILRAHIHDDANSRSVWLPIYRSHREAKPKTDVSKISFPCATVAKGHLCNGDEERRLRILLKVWDVCTKKPGYSKCRIVGYIDLTLRDLCEVDPTKDFFEIETDLEASHDEEWLSMGFVSVEKAEPTELGSYFSLLVHYESNTKFISSFHIIPSPKQSYQGLWKHGKLRRGKSCTMQVDSPSSSQGHFSPVNSLLSPLSYEAANLRGELPLSELSQRQALDLFDDETDPPDSASKSEELFSGVDILNVAECMSRKMHV